VNLRVSMTRELGIGEQCKDIHGQAPLTLAPFFRLQLKFMIISEN